MEKNEYGSKVGGNRVHFPLCTSETPSQSSEEQSEQPTVSQHLWRLEAKLEGIEKSDSKEIALGQ